MSVITKVAKIYFIFILVAIILTSLVTITSKAATKNTVSSLRGSPKDSYYQSILSTGSENSQSTEQFNPSTNVTCMVNNSVNKTFGVNTNSDNNLLNTENISQYNKVNPLATGVKVGGNPFSISVNSESNIIYVADKLSKKITFLDGNTDKPIKTVTMANSKSSNLPSNIEDLKSSIAFAPLVNLLYVGSTDSDIISAIDGNDGGLVTNKAVDGGVKGLDANVANVYAITNRTIWPIYQLANRMEFRSTIQSPSADLYAVADNQNMSKVYALSISDDTVYVKDEERGNISGIAIMKAPDDANYNLEPHGIAVNPNTNMTYVTEYQSHYVFVIDDKKDRGLCLIPVGNNPHGIAVNPNTNKIYVSNTGDNTVSVIDGKTDHVITIIPVGTEPRGIAVNPNTNKIYVANRASGTVSVINGSSDSVIAWITFSISPQNSGALYCSTSNASPFSDMGWKKISSNDSSYDFNSELKCKAKPNYGFAFSSWSGDLALQNPKIISTVFDFVNYYWISGQNNNNSNTNGNSTNNPITAFTVSKYGRLNANFIVPTEFSFSIQTLASLYAVVLASIGGSFVPAITNWLKVRKQRKRRELAYMKRIDILDHKDDKFNEQIGSLKKEILESFVKGDITESQYEALNKHLEEHTKGKQNV